MNDMCASNSHAMQIVRALRGQWHGRSGMARCPAHPDRIPSLAITEQDGRILIHCHAGCDQKSVVSALYRLGLWPTRDCVTPARDAAVAGPCRYETNVVDRSKREIALHIWQATCQAEESLVERYLRHRGIGISAPHSLRFAPHLFHAPRGQHLPAIVAAVQDSENTISAVQRVFIRKDGLGKADVSPAKMCLGTQGDGAVRLAPAGEITGLCEGWETGLSAMQLHDLPVWCALGASRMHRVLLPAIVRKIVIFADNDLAGRAAAERTAEIHRRNGRNVEIRWPNVTGDFNDELVAGQQ